MPGREGATATTPLTWRPGHTSKEGAGSGGRRKALLLEAAHMEAGTSDTGTIQLAVALVLPTKLQNIASTTMGQTDHQSPFPPRLLPLIIRPAIDGQWGFPRQPPGELQGRARSDPVALRRVGSTSDACSVPRHWLA